MGAATFPMTLNPGQTATMELEFDPTTAGAATGQLTLASSSSGGSTAVVNLSGSANAMLYNVSLNWEEPTDTTGTIAGFNVYRASSGSTMYQMVSTTMAKGTSFVDSTVQNGDSYDYYVETVDTAGLASVPSSVVAMAIPN
jgi:fibronectin type 3 domain-containing protein